MSRPGLALGALLVLVAVSTLPPAEAQSGVSFLGARLVVDAKVSLDDLRAYTDMRDPVTQDPGTGLVEPTGGCGSAEVTLVPGGFRFEEGSDETGCLEAVLDLPVPPGAAHVSVSFEATRAVQQTINTFGEEFPPVDFVQTFRFLDGARNISSEVPVFNSATTTQLDPEPVAAGMDLQPGQERLRISWYFDDRAQLQNQLATNPTRAQAFTAETTNIAVQFDGLPVAAEWALTDRAVFPGEVEASYRLGMDVPFQPFDGGRPGLEFVLAERMDVMGVQAPNGSTIPSEAVEVRTEGSTTIFTVPAEVLATHGPGHYSVHLGSVEAVAPTASLLPTALAALFVPAGAGLYGYSQERRLRSVVGKTGLRNALVNYRFALTAVTVLYGALLAIVFLSGHVWALVVPPLGLTAAVYIASFLVVATLFLVVATYGFQRQTALAETEVEVLERARRDLERSNQDLEHFAYIASHDLQEPLRTISGFSQLLERRYGEQLDDQGRRYIQKTVDGSVRMQNLIGDLLAYSRVSTGSAHSEPVDVGALFDEEVADLKVILRETKGRVERSALPTLVADRSQLRQVFGNLLRNAIKYRHADRSPHVHVDAVLEGRHWHFRVRDNGKGIPEDQHERIFVIFQRLEQKYDGEGTGLGLAIVQKIVERHGGRVWVESEVGVGSTFHFLLPAESPGDQP